MSTMVGADEAARLLGVTKPTLYAYVSRGLVERSTAVDGRTSLYPRDQVERLARERSGRRRPVERPSIDVQIASSITELRDDTVLFRGRDAVELATSHPFESVAELLWTGALPAEPPTWPVDAELLERCRSTLDAARPPDDLAALAIAATLIAGPAGETSDGPATARRLLAVAPSVLGGPTEGSIASRVAGALTPDPSHELVTAIDRALCLLADHELATSTLGVRVACSVRCDPADAIATGLHIVRGPLHGTAAQEAARLFDEASVSGPVVAIERRLAAGERLPGFGHTVYRRGDPRFEPLLDAARDVAAREERWVIVDSVIREAGRRVGHAPNVDLALGALAVVADLPRDAPIFAIARIAGWAAHFDEERTERRVRFRGLATRR